MIPIWVFLSVVSIWSVAVVTPGPNFFITVQTTVNQSRIAGMFVVLGICTGTILWAMAGYFGIAYLFTIAPWIYLSLKIVGGSYLIYLGIKFIISSNPSKNRLNRPVSASRSYFQSWRRGFFTILANPKTAMFITSLFASVFPKEPTLWIGMISILLMTVISFTWYSAVVILFSSKKIIKFYQRIQYGIEGFAGAVFIAFGTKLILENR